MKHPSEVAPQDVLLWRDRLRSQRKSAATVSFKLSVVRSFFEYLKAAGAVPLNPASTKLISPPELRSEPTGRALTTKEVRYLLSGPDRSQPEEHYVVVGCNGRFGRVFAAKLAGEGVAVSGIDR